MLCDYTDYNHSELTSLFIEFGVDDFIAPAIAMRYQEKYTEPPYTDSEVADQINGLIQDEVNRAISALVDEGRCFLTIDEEGNNFHVGKPI